MAGAAPLNRKGLSAAGWPGLRYAETPATRCQLRKRLSGEEWVMSPRRFVTLLAVALLLAASHLAAGADAGFVKQALQDRLHVAFGYLQTPGDLLVR